MFARILVAVDGSRSSRTALQKAVEIARAVNAELTLIAVAPPISSYVSLAGVPPKLMSEELVRWAEGVLDEAAADVPDGISVHRVLRSGHAGPEILDELVHGRYDLVVLGSRGRGRAREGLFGSVNGYIHFHAPVPLLTVPDDADPAPAPASS